MAEENSKPEMTIVQIADFAPHIAILLKTYTSRLRGNIATGDVVNTYGFTITYQVFVEVLTDYCANCGETQFSKPVFDCLTHKFKKEWREVASGEAKEGLQAAIARADDRVKEWLAGRQ